MLKKLKARNKVNCKEFYSLKLTNCEWHTRLGEG